MTTPTTDAREREDIAARLCVFGWSIDGLNDPDLDEVERLRIHDLAGWVMRDRAAILAAERARVRAVVLSQPEVFVPMSMRVGRNDERYIDGANLLARLDAEPTP